MTQEHNESADEDVNEAIDTESSEEEASPALNRAQRRAQAHGKNAASGVISPAGRLGGAQSGGSRSGGHAGQVRFPRTGHK